MPVSPCRTVFACRTLVPRVLARVLVLVFINHLGFRLGWRVLVLVARALVALVAQLAVGGCECEGCSGLRGRWMTRVFL